MANSDATKDALINEILSSPCDVERFWKHVDKSGDCWIWRAKKLKGYGYFKYSGLHLSATRIMWRLNGRELLSALKLCHHCDNPPCVRPEHLFHASHSENMKDSVRKGRTIVPPSAIALKARWAKHKKSANES